MKKTLIRSVMVVFFVFGNHVLSMADSLFDGTWEGNGTERGGGRQKMRVQIMTNDAVVAVLSDDLTTVGRAVPGINAYTGSLLEEEELPTLHVKDCPSDESLQREIFLTHHWKDDELRGALSDRDGEVIRAITLRRGSAREQHRKSIRRGPKSEGPRQKKSRK